MWASPSVSELPHVAVHAQHLEPFRVSVLPEPHQRPRPAAFAIPGAGAQRTTMLGAIVVHVIDAQKSGFRLSATRAFPAVCRDYFIAQVAPEIPCPDALGRLPLRVGHLLVVVSAPIILDLFSVLRVVLTHVRGLTCVAHAATRQRVETAAMLTCFHAAII